MSEPVPSAYEARLAALEKEIRDLRARVAALQKLLTDRPEHSVDRTLTRDKATYDWQGPR